MATNITKQQNQSIETSWAIGDSVYAAYTKLGKVVPANTIQKMYEDMDTESRIACSHHHNFRYG